MTDKEWFEKVKKITNPIEMLELIVEDESYFGYDSYYADFRNAMLRQATKISNEDNTGEVTMFYLFLTHVWGSCQPVCECNLYTINLWRELSNDSRRKSSLDRAKVQGV